jgi:ribosomal protein S28E/S33
MASSGVLQVERVELRSDDDVVCIVRCLSGTVRVGDTVHVLEPDGDSRSVVGTQLISSLWRYDRPVEFVDAPHVAKASIGGSAGAVEIGWRLAVIELREPT